MSLTRRFVATKKDVSVVVVDNIPGLGSKGQIKKGDWDIFCVFFECDREGFGFFHFFFFFFFFLNPPSVRPGFARNHLFPKKMALYDTPINRIKFEEFTSTLHVEDKKVEERRVAAIARLETVAVRLKRKVVESDAKGGKRTLHAPLFVDDVLQALWRQHYIALESDRVTLDPAGITSLGQHTLNVVVGDGSKKTVAKLVVVVEAR
jgi:ribosomal protein L9